MWSEGDEYTVLGSRWMDCIGRVVTRPSDWEHRESTTWPVGWDHALGGVFRGRASRERSEIQRVQFKRKRRKKRPWRLPSAKSEHD